MRQQWIKFTATAVLLGAVLLNCSGFIRAQEPTEQPQAPQAAQAAEAATEQRAQAAPELVLVRMLVKAEALPVGAQLTLYREGEDTPVQTLTLNAQHEAVTTAVEPDEYRMISEEGDVVTFRLRENAAVEVLGGYGWSDGEMLCLSRSPVCSLRIVRRTDDGAIYTYCLEGGGKQRGNILHRQQGTSSGECQFFGLPEGDYVLYENGVRAATLRLCADRPLVTLRIGWGETVLETPQ